jgi:signal peptidase I
MAHRSLLILTAFASLSASAVQPYRAVVVVGESMSPTYTDRELILSRRVNRPIQRGDVVLLKINGSTQIKRVSRIAGDEMLYWKSRTTWVDITESARSVDRFRSDSRLRVDVIPDNYVYVIGDNLGKSVDSREYGVVPISSIKGIVVSQRPKPKEDTIDLDGTNRSGSSRGPAGSRDPGSR